jgi:hypothetical protein
MMLMMLLLEGDAIGQLEMPATRKPKPARAEKLQNPVFLIFTILYSHY